MKAASARTSRAPCPRSNGKPEPVILAPAGRSRMPSAAPSSQCGLAAKSNCGGSPQARTTRLADASPSGSSSSGKFGHAQRGSSSSAASISRSSRVELLHFFARDLEPRHEIVGGLPGALPPRHFFTGRVALGLERLDAPQDLPPPPVELEQLVQQTGQRRIAHDATGSRGSPGDPDADA